METNSVIPEPEQAITEEDAWGKLRKYSIILSDSQKSKIQIIEDWRGLGLIKESTKSWYGIT